MDNREGCITGFYNGYGGGFNNSLFPSFVEIFMILIFIVFIIMFVRIIVVSARQGIKNSNSPVLSVDARVVTKRTDISYHSDHMDDGIDTSSSSTWYYVTFEVESGDRMEFSVRSSEFGMLVEGDRGKLKFQGTRYLGFVRQI